MSNFTLYSLPLAMSFYLAVHDDMISFLPGFARLNIMYGG